MEKIETIKRSIESLRSDKFPEVPSKLVERVIQIEAEFMDDRASAKRQIAQLINDFLSIENA